MMSLSLNWTYQRDRVSLLVKFGQNFFFLFKYCVEVKNCESFKSFGYIYIYIDYVTISKLELPPNKTDNFDIAI